MKLARHIITTGILALAACGGDDGGDDDSRIDARVTPDQPDAGGHASCTVTATATPDLVARTINGVGTIQCNHPAGLHVETCVQWNASGLFEDIMCLSSSMSGVAQLEVDNLSSCGFGTGRRYRARVNATVDGTAQAEVVSTDVGCE